MNSFKFVDILETKFEDTAAYKLGIIDHRGNKTPNFQITKTEQRNAYTPLHKVLFNVKKLLESSNNNRSLASYASALYLLKDRFGISEKKIESGLRDIGFHTIDFMMEDTKWFVLDDGMLSPGIYKLSHSKVVNSTLDELAKPNEFVRIDNGSYPIGSLFGINIYEATHVRSQQKVYITVAELKI